jgi:hypothetical protein
MNLNPFISERYFENFVVNNSIENNMCPLTDKDYKYVYTQQELSRHGVTDIIYIDWDDVEAPEHKHIRVTVIELKNVRLMAKHVSQLLRYIKALEISLQAFQKKLGFTYELDGVLAGLPSKEKDFDFLADAFPFISVLNAGINEVGEFKKKSALSNKYSKEMSFSSAEFVIKEAYYNYD